MDDAGEAAAETKVEKLLESARIELRQVAELSEAYLVEGDAVLQELVQRQRVSIQSWADFRNYASSVRIATVRLDACLQEANGAVAALVKAKKLKQGQEHNTLAFLKQSFGRLLAEARSVRDAVIAKQPVQGPAAPPQSRPVVQAGMVLTRGEGLGTIRKVALPKQELTAEQKRALKEQEISTAARALCTEIEDYAHFVASDKCDGPNFAKRGKVLLHRCNGLGVAAEDSFSDRISEIKRLVADAIRSGFDALFGTCHGDIRPAIRQLQAALIIGREIRMALGERFVESKMLEQQANVARWGQVSSASTSGTVPSTWKELASTGHLYTDTGEKVPQQVQETRSAPVSNTINQKTRTSAQAPSQPTARDKEFLEIEKLMEQRK